MNMTSLVALLLLSAVQASLGKKGKKGKKTSSFELPNFSWVVGNWTACDVSRLVQDETSAIILRADTGCPGNGAFGGFLIEELPGPPTGQHYILKSVRPEPCFQVGIPDAECPNVPEVGPIDGFTKIVSTHYGVGNLGNPYKMNFVSINTKVMLQDETWVEIDVDGHDPDKYVCEDPSEGSDEGVIFCEALFDETRFDENGVVTRYYIQQSARFLTDPSECEFCVI